MPGFSYWFSGTAITTFIVVVGSATALIGSGYGWYRADISEQQSAGQKLVERTKTDDQQKAAILQKLTQEYILSHSDISPRLPLA